MDFLELVISFVHRVLSLLNRIFISKEGPQLLWIKLYFTIIITLHYGLRFPQIEVWPFKQCGVPGNHKYSRRKCCWLSGMKIDRPSKTKLTYFVCAKHRTTGLLAACIKYFPITAGIKVWKWVPSWAEVRYLTRSMCDYNHTLCTQLLKKPSVIIRTSLVWSQLLHH